MEPAAKAPPPPPPAAASVLADLDSTPFLSSSTSRLAALPRNTAWIFSAASSSSFSAAALEAAAAASASALAFAAATIESASLCRVGVDARELRDAPCLRLDEGFGGGDAEVGTLHAAIGRRVRGAPAPARVRSRCASMLGRWLGRGRPAVATGAGGTPAAGAVRLASASAATADEA